MQRIFFRKCIYFILDLIVRLKTKIFSETMIASGYLIKNAFYYRHSTAVTFNKDRYYLHEAIAKQYLPKDEKILYIEFGVHRGDILRDWVSYNSNIGTTFWGFDTFTGIPEDWGNIKAGSFSSEGMVPKLNDQRVVFQIGLVQNTLPKLLKDIDSSKRLILHFDFDLYNATLFAMLCLQPYFKKGDIFIFDEFFSISKNHHEFRAFKDFLSLFNLVYKPLYKVRQGQYAIELL